jgi:O-antigen/teichoic acid export membrane protein
MKSERETIWKNSVFVSFSQIIRVVTNLLIFIGIARFYSTEALGQFSIAFQVANICLIIADFGFDTLLTTSIGNQRENPLKISREYFSMKVVFAGIATLIMISVPTFQSMSNMSALLIYSLVLYVVFSTFNNYCYAIFRGFQKFEYETKNSFISNLLLLALLVLFGALHLPLIYIMLFFVLSRLLSAILGISVVNKLVGGNVMALDFTDAKIIIKEILVFGLQYIFGNLYFLLDTILIGIWLGDAATGIYQASFRIMLLALIVVDVIRSPLLPVFSKLFYVDKDKWVMMNRLFFKVLALLAIPIGLTFYFAADLIIKVIYGPGKYLESIQLLKIFGVIIFIRFLGEPFVLILTTSRRQHILMILAMIGTFLSYFLNSLLLTTYGTMGAAIISLSVNIIVNFGMLCFIERNLISIFLEKRLLVIWAFTAIIFFGLLNYPNILFLAGALLMFIPAAYFLGLNYSERKMIFSKYAFKAIG